MAEGLEEKYLLSEMLPEPEDAEEQVYFQLFKMASKSMLEQIGTVARERQEYREYIEQWVHEIKTPITAMGRSSAFALQHQSYFYSRDKR